LIKLQIHSPGGPTTILASTAGSLVEYLTGGARSVALLQAGITAAVVRCGFPEETVLRLGLQCSHIFFGLFRG
jgi:hypothetical protein